MFSPACDPPPPPPAPDDCGCDEDPEPVCGADQRTYESVCRATCARVAVVREDPCCTVNEDCAEGEFCDLGLPCGVMGICQPIPTTCDRIVELPVCDCDGNRYSSVCAAHAQGASVAEECEPDREPSPIPQ